MVWFRRAALHILPIVLCVLASYIGDSYRTEAIFTSSYLLYSIEDFPYIQPPEPEPVVIEDRKTCNKIRGTQYYSATEREWYQDNCIVIPKLSPPKSSAQAKPLVPIPTGDIASAICSYAWPCQEALSVCQKESHCSWVYNTTGSGACGPMQTLPCVGFGNLTAHLNEAFRKWKSCQGGSFYCDWYRYW